MITQFNSEEDRVLQGCSLLAQVIYLRGIRQYMDYSTGVAGNPGICKLSISGLADIAVFVPSCCSKKKTWTPGREEVRAALGELKRVGLIIDHGSNVKDGLIFFLPLATKCQSVQNRLSHEPHDEPHDEPKTKSTIAVAHSVMNPMMNPTMNHTVATHEPHDEPHDEHHDEPHDEQQLKSTAGVACITMNTTMNPTMNPMVNPTMNPTIQIIKYIPTTHNAHARARDDFVEIHGNHVKPASAVCSSDISQLKNTQKPRNEPEPRSTADVACSVMNPIANTTANSPPNDGMPGCIPRDVWELYQQECELNTGRVMSIVRIQRCWQELSAMDLEGYDVRKVLNRCIAYGFWSFDRRLETKKSLVSTNQKPETSKTKRGNYEPSNQRLQQHVEKHSDSGFAEKYGAAIGLD